MRPQNSFKYGFLLSLFLFSALPVQAAKVFTVNFGGIYGYNYSPKSQIVEVGDTIIWKGDFQTLTLQSTSVPSGAKSFGPITSGTSFLYVVEVGGDYSYKNPIYASIGMTGSFTGIYLPHGSMTNEGREFFLGMLFPSYNTIAVGKAAGSFSLRALITTYYDNEVTISYYSSSGIEENKTTSKIGARSTLQIPLNTNAMKMDRGVEGAAYRSCHITSKYPIAVQYLSSGVNCGGSYLALPTLGLGRNYVVESYSDNAGNGGLYGGAWGGYYYPKDFEYAGGQFMIIAAEDATNITIIPTTMTLGGHTGVRTGTGANGTPRPYSIQLNKGQCYLVGSDGKDEGNDISGSIVMASNPVSVIAGHEDAGLGGVDPYMMEGRDFMIEQMLPVEFWDNAGYVSIPLAEATPPGEEGHGDSYRVYAFDPTAVNAQMDVLGIPGGYPMPTTRYAAPPQKFDIYSPVDIYSTNGKKLSVMQYDQRSQTNSPPWPAPSMMTVVPKSRWRKSYNFSVLLPTEIFGVTGNQFMNLIADSLNTIRVSVDGGPEKNLIGSFSTQASFTTVSAHYDLKGVQYKIGAGSYSLHSEYPFAVYVYGVSQLDPWGFAGSNYWTYQTEFATTAGMQLNTGIVPNISVTLDSTSQCSSWHICARDTGKNDPGIKAIILIDDTDGFYYERKGAKFHNVSFDSSSVDFLNGELRPHLHSNENYCFDVKLLSPFEAASAPIAIIDNLGNTAYIKLERSASSIKLTTDPPTPGRADSIVFQVDKIGVEICTTFVFKNNAPIGGTPVKLNSVLLTGSDTSYKIISVSHTLPYSVAAKDSVKIQVCYMPKDSSRHRNALKLQTSCFSIPVTLDAFGTKTGLINADNLDFGTVTVGNEICKDVLIRNQGAAPFTLTRSWLLTDTVNFSIDPQSASSLPVVILPNKSYSLRVCFHPKEQGSSSAQIKWATTIDPAYAESFKNFSLLSGSGTPPIVTSVGQSENPVQSMSIRPNPVSGNSAIVSFTMPKESKATLAIFDVLGRKVYHKEILSNISQLEIPVRNFSEGIYYVRLTSGSGVVTQKMEVLR